MKKNWTVFSGIVLALFLFAACSSSMERDARKGAKLTCEYMEYLAEGNFEAAEAMEEELMEYQKMIENKYDLYDAAFQQEWQDILAKALEKEDCGITIDDMR